MSKVMIVEDDESLREIYAIRLTAEGYAVVSARDGEEALAVAVKEKPDLIVSDVMMPKISGFDMLDILRSTPETQNIKVIMMTALSSEDQRVRGENLGADRYIVKSQVGIEDVVNVVHEVLGDRDPNSGTIDTEAPVEVPARQLTEMQMENASVVPGAEMMMDNVANSATGQATTTSNNGQGAGFTTAEQVTNIPSQAMPPISSEPTFTSSEQVTNIPTQAMPPIGGGPNTATMEQSSNTVASTMQNSDIPTPVMPPSPETSEQASAIPPSIMPPASTEM